MATTTFQNGITLTDEDWFNDVDFLVYDLFGDSTTTASAAARLIPSITSLGAITFTSTISVSAGATFANATVAGTLSVSATAAFAGVQVGGTLSVSAGVAGAAVATQANMESAASTGSTSLIVTPGRMQYHPGVAKAWVRFDGTATSVTSGAAYNVASITDNGTGDYTITWTNPFSSGNYAIEVSGNLYNSRLASVSATNAQVTFLDLSGTAADASIVCVAAFGDQ